MQAIAARLLLCCLLAASVTCSPGSPCDRSVDVAIVGAGSAGSYFAYRLRRAGLNIELFEYSDRIGGRLFTAAFHHTPDVKMELGGMRYIDGEHVRVQRLIRELSLTPIEFTARLGKTKNTKYFLRGKVLTVDEVSHGEVPYHLSPQEKEHQSNLGPYYFQQLTGSHVRVTNEEALRMTTLHGLEMYKLTLDQAMGMVATPDGWELLKTIATPYYGLVHSDISALEYYLRLSKIPHNGTILTVKEGMSSIPQSLAKAFLKSSRRHKVTINRKLENITRIAGGFYKLRLQRTKTTDGLTVGMKSAEHVCAKKVVLAITQLALTQLNWAPLRHPKVKQALSAVTPVKASKVYMTFPTAWWLRDPVPLVVSSDTTFRSMYDWKFSNVSGDHVLLASYAQGYVAEFQNRLNSKGILAPGSAPGANKVTNRLKHELLRQIGQALGIDARRLPAPTGAMAQFWTSYPYGGGWTNWRAGYNYTDVLQTIRRPSSLDDVYIVGADYGDIGMTSWVESAFLTVDMVYDKYFTQFPKRMGSRYNVLFKFQSGHAR